MYEECTLEINQKQLNQLNQWRTQRNAVEVLRCRSWRRLATALGPIFQTLRVANRQKSFRKTEKFHFTTWENPKQRLGMRKECFLNIASSRSNVNLFQHLGPPLQIHQTSGTQRCFFASACKANQEFTTSLHLSKHRENQWRKTTSTRRPFTSSCTSCVRLVSMHLVQQGNALSPGPTATHHLDQRRDMPTFVTQDLAYVTPGHSTVAELIWHKMHFWHPIPGCSPVGKRSNHRTHLFSHGNNTRIERLNRIWNVKHLSKIRLK